LGPRAISDDGRYLLLGCGGPPLVRWDRDTGPTVSAVVDYTTGAEINNEAADSTLEADMSSDGSKVVFFSSLRNLVADDPTSYADTYVRDFNTNTTTRVQIDYQGSINIPVGLYPPSISGDGTTVAVVKAGSFFYFNQQWTYVVDLLSGAADLGVKAADGGFPNWGTVHPQLSDDGKSLLFESSATNLGATTGEAGGAFVAKGPCCNYLSLMVVPGGSCSSSPGGSRAA